MATYWPRHVLESQLGNYGPYLTRLHRCLQDLADKGVLLITGAGNVAGGLSVDVVDGWPANFGKADTADRIPTLIVAGAISCDGKTIGHRSDVAAGKLHGSLMME